MVHQGPAVDGQPPPSRPQPPAVAFQSPLGPPRLWGPRPRCPGVVEPGSAGRWLGYGVPRQGFEGAPQQSWQEGLRRREGLAWLRLRHERWRTSCQALPRGRGLHAGPSRAPPGQARARPPPSPPAPRDRLAPDPGHFVWEGSRPGRSAATRMAWWGRWSRRTARRAPPRGESGGGRRDGGAVKEGRRGRGPGVK